MKTYQPKANEINRSWHLVDAKGQVLGRMATCVARLLIGKQKVNYAPHMDMGDYVVVVNAKNMVLTGDKKEKKIYYRHSGYPGGFREIKFRDLFNKNPLKVVELAVFRMLPKNRLQSKRMVRLKIYADEKHPYKDKFKIKNEKL